MRRSLSKHRGYGIWNWCSQGGMGEYIVLKKQNRKLSQSYLLQQYAVMMCNKSNQKEVLILPDIIPSIMKYITWKWILEP